MGRILTAEKPLKKPIDGSKSLEVKMLVFKTEKDKEKRVVSEEGNLDKMPKIEVGNLQKILKGRRNVLANVFPHLA